MSKVSDDVDKAIAELRSIPREMLSTRNDHILLLDEAIRSLSRAIKENQEPLLWLEMYHALVNLSAATTLLLETFGDSTVPVSER